MLHSEVILCYVPASCYLPDGKIAPGYQPCNITTGNEGSACCQLSASTCTTAGYCNGNDSYTYQGGCTDPTWMSPNCPEQCRSGEQSFGALGGND